MNLSKRIDLAIAPDTFAGNIPVILRLIDFLIPNETASSIIHFSGTLAAALAISGFPPPTSPCTPANQSVFMSFSEYVEFCLKRARFSSIANAWRRWSTFSTF